MNYLVERANSELDFYLLWDIRAPYEVMTANTGKDAEDENGRAAQGTSAVTAKVVDIKNELQSKL